MDYSIRSLRNLKGDEKGKRRHEQNDQYKDKMSQIISDVRNLMVSKNVSSLNIAAILSQLQKQKPAEYGQRNFRKDNLLDTLNHYKSLSVVYVDPDENVIFL